MGARDSRVRVAALEWYEAIVLASPDGLPYDDAHRVALLVAACQAHGGTTAAKEELRATFDRKLAKMAAVETVGDSVRLGRGHREEV